MKKKLLNVMFIVSLLVNLLLFIFYFIPKYWFIGLSSGYFEGGSFSAGGFVNPINFEGPKNMSEAYIIYGIYDYTIDKMSYFYTNMLGDRGGLAVSDLSPLAVKHDNKNELVLYDDVFEFTINKLIPGITGKDKDGNVFELGLDKYIGF